MEPIIHTVLPTYRRENGLWVITIDQIPLPPHFIAHERNLASIPPHQYGGNHKHPRRELMIGIGALEFAWIDGDGITKTRTMSNPSHILMIEVPPFLPHAVYNASENDATLFEFADGPQRGVVTVEVIKKAL